MRAYSNITFLALTAVLLATPLTGVTQTLNEQYDYYLANNCENMNLERVGADQVAPGLAGENLAKYCGRAQANMPGAIGTNSAGGASATRGASTPNPLARKQMAMRSLKVA